MKTDLIEFINDKMWEKPSITLIDINKTESGLANDTEDEGGSLS